MAYTPQTLLGKTMARVASQIVNSTSGGSPALTVNSGRVYTGWNARSASASSPNNLSLVDDVYANGILVGIGLPTGTLDNVQAKTGMMYCSVQVWIAKDLNTSWSALDVADLLKVMLDRILDSTAYTTGEIVPRLAGIVGHEYEKSQTKGLHCSTLMFSFFDPETEISDQERLKSWLGSRARKNK